MKKFIGTLIRRFTPTPNFFGVSHAKVGRGFTLIELLVVIAIIGILASVVSLSLQSSRAKGRDARRIADIRSIISALELYFLEEGGYPEGTDLVLDGEYLCAAGPDAGWSDTACTSDQEHLIQTAPAPVPPDNPTGVSDCDFTTNAFTYNERFDGAGFDLSFCLGRDTGDFSAGICTANEEGLTC